VIDRDRVGKLLARERSSYRERHPRSRAAYQAAAASLLGSVPMTWMNMAAGGFPVALAEARGARLTDLDGHEYLDLCLGDTAAMAGHSPEPVVRAVERRYGRAGGATAMLPTEDAAWVGAELGRRFGVPLWSFTLTATDANRWAIRLARLVTGRPKILVFNWCYHGTVDETLVTLRPRGSVAREGNVGAPVDPARTTRVVEFNDLEALERELAHGDVACVLMEPALTNIGIVLPRPGYLQGVRELTRRHGALLVNDETHTLSAGPGGCTAAWGLEPDMVTVGKAIAGGLPAGAYGLTRELARRVQARDDADLVDTGGVGGTLAGNALSSAAARATLEHVLTESAFAGMVALATRLTDGVRGSLEARGVPWSIVQLGARAEVRFTAPPPVDRGQSAPARATDREENHHLKRPNRLIHPDLPVP
jgi:glutamate-1-semialdehyde 2,1-aminomutase